MHQEQFFRNTISKQWFHKLLTFFPSDATYGIIKTTQILTHRSLGYHILELQKLITHIW